MSYESKNAGCVVEQERPLCPFEVLLTLCICDALEVLSALLGSCGDLLAVHISGGVC